MKNNLNNQINMKKIYLLLFAILVLSACNSRSQQIPDQSQEQPVDKISSITYTLDDVAKHSTPDDCWIVLHGKVYDVSGFGTSDHPGGEAVYEGCGVDATELFETRPMGSGTPHSEKAREFTDNFYVGDLSS
jgi:cytochrome b involved in lipid metabolism